MKALGRTSPKARTKPATHRAGHRDRDAFHRCSTVGKEGPHQQINSVAPRPERDHVHVAFDHICCRVCLGEGLARIAVPLGASDDVKPGLLEPDRQPAGSGEDVEGTPSRR